MIQIFIIGVGVVCFGFGMLVGAWVARGFDLLPSSDDRPRCQHDGISYYSIPPQYRCRNCREYWIQGERAPVCALSPCQF